MLPLATLAVLAFWGAVAPEVIAQDLGKADGPRSAARVQGSGTALAPRDERSPRSDPRDSRPAGPGDRTGDGRAPRDRAARSSPAPEHGSPSRDEADEASDLRESIRARTEAIRDRVRERRESLRRRVRARVEALRHDARDGARRNDRGSPRPRPPKRARPDAAEATVSITSRERIKFLPGRRHILRGSRALVRGHVPSGRSGRTVVLETLTSRGWVERDRALTGADGKFYLAWYPSRAGRFRVRAREVKASSDTLPSHARLLYVYRRAVASWYGPGFYGNRTACGQTFTRRLLGVAHRSLACGYRVTVRYRGRAITVPVVDRGPYVDGRDYDLTNATREYLDFEGVDEIWATT